MTGRSWELTSAWLDPATLLELDQARRETVIRADVPTLTAMFADDMVWIHGNGGVDTKQGLLDSIGSGRAKFLAMDCQATSPGPPGFRAATVLTGRSGMP